MRVNVFALEYMKKMPAFSLPWQRRLENPSQMESSATPFYAMWDAVARFAQEIRASEFTTEMIRRRDTYGSEGVMGALDCATLYGLTRWLRPAVVVEYSSTTALPPGWICRVDDGRNLLISKP